MEQIRQYLLSIVAAGIVCSIVSRFATQKNLLSGILKLLAGIFMSITVVSPVIKLQIGDLLDYIDYIQTDTQSVVADGHDIVAEEKSTIIKQEVTSYILDKADSLGVKINVLVELSDADLMLPDRVTLSGKISPYAKTQLTTMIENDLGIPEEKQIWK